MEFLKICLVVAFILFIFILFLIGIVYLCIAFQKNEKSYSTIAYCFFILSVIFCLLGFNLEQII